MSLRVSLLSSAIGVLLLAGPGKAVSPPTWVVTSTGGLNYTVTFTNTDASHVNAIGVANANHTGDPVTGMSADGWTCNAYAPGGSYTCSGDVAPTKKVVFLVTVQTALDSSVPWEACYSTDSGAHLTCQDNIPSAKQAPQNVADAYWDLRAAITEETKALEAKKIAGAVRQLNHSLLNLRDVKKAFTQAGGDLAPEVAPIASAMKKDEFALKDLTHKNVRLAHAHIRAAMEKKDAVRSALEEMYPGGFPPPDDGRPAR